MRLKLVHYIVLFALGTLSRAWQADFSDAAQCGTVTVNWNATANEQIGPPFVVRMAAFGLAPLIITAPSASWSDSSRAGSFSFSVPWPEGTDYISTMDDGFGAGTGGISGIQTVKSSSNSSCLSTDVTEPQHIFDIAGSFVQCSLVSMNWSEPSTAQTQIAGLVPNGVAFQLDPPLTNSKSTTWDLNIPAGTAFVLIYSDASGNGNMTSPLLQSLGDGSDSSCLSSGAHPSATASQIGIAQVSVTATPSTSGASVAPSTTQDSESSKNRSKLGPILGAVFGVLAFLVALGLLLCIIMRRRKRPRVLRPFSQELSKGINLDAQETQLQLGSPSPSPRSPRGDTILPFVLPYAGSSQDNSSTSRRSDKRPPHSPHSPSNPSNTSDSSHGYTNTTNTFGQPSSPPGLRSSRHVSSETGQENENEPVIIRHEDGGAVTLPRVREVIELPPGYDQLPSSSTLVQHGPQQNS
ncbi:hypothetical protein VKT23_003535 [Stygiomarasmius scandens]|uniref:Uncharacterized protein n=1 Tax=Marasmiellus scandens TaxID=2682957 RepID=A0ABR1K1L1_9AGAR